MKRRVKNQNPNWETRWIGFLKWFKKFESDAEKKRKRGCCCLAEMMKFQKGRNNKRVKHRKVRT